MVICVYVEGDGDVASCLTVAGQPASRLHAWEMVGLSYPVDLDLKMTDLSRSIVIRALFVKQTFFETTIIFPSLPVVCTYVCRNRRFRSDRMGL